MVSCGRSGNDFVQEEWVVQEEIELNSYLLMMF